MNKRKHANTWLELMGFYRKSVAHDESCLFRAASEQIFDCQIHHEKVRKECIKYGQENILEVSHLANSVEDFLDHLDKLEKHLVVCGYIELHLIALKYKRNVVIFDPMHFRVYNFTKYNFDQLLYFCRMANGHYDLVYKKEHMLIAGFCQSIVYNVVYGNVLPDVEEPIKRMLYGAELFPTQGNGYVLPKIAKALNPNIYRNIEFDSWIEIIKGTPGLSNEKTGDVCTLRSLIAYGKGSPNTESARSADDHSYKGAPLMIRPFTGNPSPGISCMAADAIKLLTTYNTPEERTLLLEFQRDSPPTPSYPCNTFKAPVASQVFWPQVLAPQTRQQLPFMPMNTSASAPPISNYYDPYCYNSNNRCNTPPVFSTTGSLPSTLKLLYTPPIVMPMYMPPPTVMLVYTTTAIYHRFTGF